MKFLDRLEEWIIASLMGVATIIIFVAVLHRYLSGLPIPWLQDYLLTINMSWAQELCIYMFVWMAKFGAAYGVRTGIHVGVDVLINRLSERWRKKVVVFGLLAGALFTGVVEWPMWIVYLAVPLGSYLMCFRFLQVTAQFIRHGELPKHDHAYVEGLEDEIQEAREQAV
jgi:C4-dicarboxylate transporter DctQ subunit